MSLLLGRGDATRDVRRRAMEAYKVHPLVLVEISDYFTRTKMNIDPPEAEPDRLIGCLLGTQTPREVEINSSFECLYARPDGANGAIELDWKFLSEQKDRYKQTHAKLEIVGWYSTGEALDPVVDVAVTRALASRGVAESPVFMLYDPYLNDKKAEAYERTKQAASSAGGGGGSGGNSGGGGGGDDAAVGPMEGINTRDALTGAAAEIPIGLHRAVQRGGDVLALELVKYSIVTDEAERIAIDDLMRAGDWGQQTPAGQYLSHLRGMADATRMLETRVGAVLNHLRDVQARLVVSSDACPFSPRSLSIPTHTPRRLSTPLLTPFNSTPTFVASYGQTPSTPTASRAARRRSTTTSSARRCG